jgi:hypothetical protein
MEQFWGVLSAVLGLSAFVPYVLAILRKPGKIRPDRTSYLIWSGQYVVLFAAQFARGARSSLWLIGAVMIGCLVISALSVPFGTGRVTRANAVVVASVAAALAAWYFTSSPSAAIVLMVAVDVTAGALTAVKAYRLPGSEPRTAWLISGTAALVNLLAVGHGPQILYLYPVSGAVMAAAIIGAAQRGAARARPPAGYQTPRQQRPTRAEETPAGEAAADPRPGPGQVAGLPGRAAAHPVLVMSHPGPAGSQDPPAGGFWLSRQPHPPVAGPLIKLTATSDPQLLARVLAGLRNLP